MHDLAKSLRSFFLLRTLTAGAGQASVPEKDPGEKHVFAERLPALRRGKANTVSQLAQLTE